MTGSGVTAESACPDCLRRSWLVAKLAPNIQVSCDDRPGRRTPELLRLENEALAAAVAPGQADAVLTANAGITEALMVNALLDSGCWACCRHDPRFPRGLTDGPDGPRVLIGKGEGFPLSELETRSSVTIVGSRRATGYGLEVARNLGRDIASTGIAVISGMALGIDGAAHRGALERGRTLAVLASGPDQAYPVSHQRLYRQILEKGLVVSEMPPGTSPRRWGFPARNRIMASMSQMTVVVEAAFRSGSLITAEMAADAGREVGAVPGQVTIGPAAGTNELIANGAALIRDARDVIDRVVGVGAMPLPIPGPPLTPELNPVLDAVERGCDTVDSAADFLARDASGIAIALARLEVLGYLTCSIAGKYSRTGQETPVES
ncbi:MAG: DNA-processing protein DprA [Solirubrobacterales bacterium]